MSLQWNGYGAGDKQDDTDTAPIVFDPKEFPPGTKIVVSEPICPKCGYHYADCSSTYDFKIEDQCDFDWKNWVEEQYS